MNSYHPLGSKVGWIYSKAAVMSLAFIDPHVRSGWLIEPRSANLIKYGMPFLTLWGKLGRRYTHNDAHLREGRDQSVKNLVLVNSVCQVVLGSSLKSCKFSHLANLSCKFLIQIQRLTTKGFWFPKESRSNTALVCNKDISKCSDGIIQRRHSLHERSNRLASPNDFLTWSY